MSNDQQHEDLPRTGMGYSLLELLAVCVIAAGVAGAILAILDWSRGGLLNSILGACIGVGIKLIWLVLVYGDRTPIVYDENDPDNLPYWDY